MSEHKSVSANTQPFSSMFYVINTFSDFPDFVVSSTDAPVCVSGQQIQYGTAKSEAAHVVCQVDANPADVTFRWQFNSSTETLDLPFSQVSSPHHGDIYCSFETFAVRSTPITVYNFACHNKRSIRRCW